MTLSVMNISVNQDGFVQFYEYDIDDKNHFVHIK